MRQPESPCSSPVKKRQRLSSPPYEGSIDSLSQDDLASIDALETKYLQSISSSCKLSYDTNAMLNSTDKSDDHVDDKNPFLDALPGFASASLLRSKLETPVGKKLQGDLAKFDNLEPEPTYDTWFQPASNAQFPAFQAATGTTDITPSSSASIGSTLVGIGFTTAGKKSIYAPSKAALAAAQAKIEAIWNDEEELQDDSANSPQMTGDVFAGTSSLQQRSALRAVENAFRSPKTPLYLAANSKNLGFIPLSPLLERSKDKGKGKAKDAEGIENVHCDSSAPTNPCRVNPSNLKNLKQFVSPLLAHRTGQQAAVESSPTPALQNKYNLAPADASIQLPAFQRHFVTPRRVLPTTGIAQSYPTTGMRKGAISRPFVTPFKSGIKPQEHGNTLRKNSLEKTPYQSKVATAHCPGEKCPCLRFFQLTPPANRVTLKSSGLLPQQYEIDDLDKNLIELKQIAPSLAPFYSFNSSGANNSRSTVDTLGVATAFDELKRRGCSLATKPWVDNHWSLILWKLSGMALLDPQQEKDPSKRKWCWTEVIRQLLYRYERELNQGKRPALRMITTQDASVACPMVLCISDIFWSEKGLTADGLAIDRVPELEVTDGWYRLRAGVDPPMARAIGRGVIRIGRKIGVAGARLSSEKKEPTEVLEGYNNVKLLLSGNSSHLMPWHTKLGFQPIPFVSTLHSLTADGGCIAVLDVVVTKVYPIAYFEFFEDSGRKRREGPRNEAEEIKLHDKWKRSREQEASKLRSNLDKRFNRFESYADRLIRRAGTKFNPSDDELPPADMDELYELLEDHTEANATIARLNPMEAGWLSRHIRISMEKEMTKAGDDIERDLKKCCPPREVRSFRVVVVKDAYTRRRPANRVAQITVWDVPSLSSEKESQIFQVGQRYLITNLTPTQQSAWMNHEPDSQIFLSTRRDSRWTRKYE